MNIYIAASFCYEDKDKTSQRKYLIEQTVKRIQKKLKGNYYIPHKLTIPNAWDISLEEWSNAVYQHDMAALNSADIIIFLSFGKENNAGSVWEVGYIYGRNYNISTIRGNTNPYSQQIIMIKMTDEIESLMLTNSVNAIISEKEIESYDWVNRPSYKTALSKIS